MTAAAVRVVPCSPSAVQRQTASSLKHFSSCQLCVVAQVLSQNGGDFGAYLATFGYYILRGTHPKRRSLQVQPISEPVLSLLSCTGQIKAAVSDEPFRAIL